MFNALNKSFVSWLPMQKHPHQRKCMISEGEVVFTALALHFSANNNKGWILLQHIFIFEELQFEREHHRENLSVVMLKWLYGEIQIQSSYGAALHRRRRETICAHRNKGNGSCWGCRITSNYSFIIKMPLISLVSSRHGPGLLLVVRKCKQEHWRVKGWGEGWGNGSDHANRSSDKCKTIVRPTSKMQTCTTCLTVKHSDKDWDILDGKHKHWMCSRERHCMNSTKQTVSHCGKTNRLFLCRVQ